MKAGSLVDLDRDGWSLAGLSFDAQYAAMEFYAAVKDATANPHNVALSQENLGRLRKTQSRPEGADILALSPMQRTAKAEWTAGLNPRGPVRKAEISQPCAFAHITSLKPADLDLPILARPPVVARARSALHLSPS